MPLFCDVALPVPLDQTFTYAVNGVVPMVGARVLVVGSISGSFLAVLHVQKRRTADLTD
jgi:primosomal protein N' (replication factor Y)